MNKRSTAHIHVVRRLWSTTQPRLSPDRTSRADPLAPRAGPARASNSDALHAGRQELLLLFHSLALSHTHIALRS